MPVVVARLRPRPWGAECNGLANPHYCLLVTASAVPDPQRRASQVVVVTDGSTRSDFLHIAPDNAAQWGDDRLGKGTLPRGLALRVPLGETAGCNFKVRATYSDKREDSRTGLDLCAQPEVVFSRP